MDVIGVFEEYKAQWGQFSLVSSDIRKAKNK